MDFYDCTTGLTDYSKLWPWAYLQLWGVLLLVLWGLKIAVYKLCQWSFKWPALSVGWLGLSVGLVSALRVFSYYHWEMPWTDNHTEWIHHLMFWVAFVLLFLSDVLLFVLTDKAPFLKHAGKALFLSLPLLIPLEWIFAVMYLSDGWACYAF